MRYRDWCCVSGLWPAQAALADVRNATDPVLPDCMRVDLDVEFDAGRADTFSERWEHWFEQVSWKAGAGPAVLGWPCAAPMKRQNRPVSYIASKNAPAGVLTDISVNRCPSSLTRPVGMNPAASMIRVKRVTR